LVAGFFVVASALAYDERDKAETAPCTFPARFSRGGAYNGRNRR
jgi:hypothetical protein